MEFVAILGVELFFPLSGFVLASQLQKLESDKKLKTILSKEVTSQEIAEVISKATGIPLQKMLEGEKEKILNRFLEKIQLYIYIYIYYVIYHMLYIIKNIL